MTPDEIEQERAALLTESDEAQAAGLPLTREQVWRVAGVAVADIDGADTTDVLSEPTHNPAEVGMRGSLQHLATSVAGHPVDLQDVTYTLGNEMREGATRELVFRSASSPRSSTPSRSPPLWSSPTRSWPRPTDDEGRPS